MDELLNMARLLRKNFDCKQAALAIEIVGVTGRQFNEFLKDTRANGYPLDLIPLPVGHSATVAVKKGRSIVRVTVTTNEDHLGRVN